MVLVDEAVADQRLGEVPAAVHLQLRPVVFFLERLDALGSVPVDQDRRAPVQRGTAPRADVSVSPGSTTAGPEVLVSSTVKDLAAGSGLVLEDAGEHELKGVPGRWRLYPVSTR